VKKHLQNRAAAPKEFVDATEFLVEIVNSGLSFPAGNFQLFQIMPGAADIQVNSGIFY
jgi:hypothetical protein